MRAKVMAIGQALEEPSHTLSSMKDPQLSSPAELLVVTAVDWSWDVEILVRKRGVGRWPSTK
jgi:hypothetical protein